MKTLMDKIIACVALMAVAFFLVIGFKHTSSDASIGNMVGELGVYNSTDGTYGLEVDYQNQFHFGMTGAGIYWGITTLSQSGSPTETTLTAQQTGQTFVSMAPYAANGYISLLLPTAVQGMDFTYISGTTEQIQINPTSTDTIEYSTLTAGQSLKNTSVAKGDHIEVRASAVNTWQVYDIQGTWARGNT